MSSSPSGKVKCELCKESNEDQITGSLLTKDNVTAHQYCLLYSSGIYCQESPEVDNMFGFAEEDVSSEIKRGNRLSLKYNKKESAVKVEKTQSTRTQEEDEEEPPHPKKERANDCENASHVALTQVGTPEQFEFQYGLEGPTFHHGNGESSKSHLSIIKVEQLDHVLPEQTDTSCGSGSPDGLRAPGSSGSGSGSSPAAQFFAKCHQAGCTQFVFSEFASRFSIISERIASQQASEEDFSLTLKVLEASGMLPEIFAKRDQEMEKRLRDLQKETESLRTARSALRDACIISLSSP